jgi:hypothetical protein
VAFYIQVSSELGDFVPMCTNLVLSGDDDGGCHILTVNAVEVCQCLDMVSSRNDRDVVLQG